MGGFLEIKLVKPTKVLSRTPDKAGVDQFLSIQAQADIRAGDAGVLGEANAAVWQELGCFNPTNRILHQLAKLLTLFVCDRGPEILDLNQSLADEDHLSDLRHAGDPGVANELWIEHQ
jgi:hypothetical protein